MTRTPLQTSAVARGGALKKMVPTGPSVCCARYVGRSDDKQPVEYVVKSGDTMVAIAKRFGFAEWLEIYKHPLNAKFRAKRPNPNVIYPGDVLVIPDQPGNGLTNSKQVTAPLQTSLPYIRGEEPWLLTDEEMRIDYVHPTPIRLRLTFFWASNCGNVGATDLMITGADQIFRRYNISMDIVPSRKPTPQHLINAGTQPVRQIESVRAMAAQQYDDQKEAGGRPRLPVIFCEFEQPGHGVTKLDSNVWLPYCCIRTNTSAGDWATLAHEIVHATGDARHLTGADQRKNLMSEATGQRADIFKAHVDRLAKAYFAR